MRQRIRISPERYFVVAAVGFVALAAIAAGLLAFFRVPFRRDLAILGVLLPLGVIGQAVMGGLTVLYGLAPGWVMGHYLLSMPIVAGAAGLRARRAPRRRPDYGASSVGAVRARRGDDLRRHGGDRRGPARRRR